jgi:AraC-like DNA-binding protein
MGAAQPLTTEQCEILGALLDEEADAPDRTTDLLAKRLNMSRRQVASRLEELQGRSPPLVWLGFDETWQVQAWLPTGAGRQAYDGACRPL